MLRQTLLNVTRPALRSTVVQLRGFSMSAIQNAEGSTGAPRSGGEVQGDTFTKREKANEDYYVKQQERQKLMALKEKISQQRKQLEELDKNMYVAYDDLTWENVFGGGSELY
ncbi:hypothetical protein MMC08_001831 [Hypocenomyce scalaris]|nr:hypothetical protein [Hypocenomyce scalaris]